ncbi:MAG: nitroreductase [Lysobacterales bacterium]|nr:nitroreductase [Xanthomonadales bacterium]MCP5474914.1 nitroreductase [Rhodanobacteraceae bacterium]
MTIESKLRPLTDRQSTPQRFLGLPAPTEAELRALIEAAAKVSDHGRLRPWRLLLIHGEARDALGRALVDMRKARGDEMDEALLQKDLQRFSHAPVVIAVIARLTPDHKIPEVEQLLSAAALAQNLLIGACALGYGAIWLTGWPAYDEIALRILGVEAHEKVVGFIHIGTAQGEAPPRERPSYEQLVREWRPADMPAI